MSARQLIVLAVAFIAAIAALLVIRNMGNSARPTQAAASEIPAARVLVAARDIPQGAALAPADLVWRTFPPESMNQGFVQEQNQPSAPSDMAGWVTRRPFLAGEPITIGSIIARNERGFMAAQLAPGFRAVSIEIESGTAAGGYIQPNDRVDVIVTSRVEVQRESGGGEEEIRTDVVLEDVRVMAIGEHVQTQAGGQAPERAQGDFAVLELSADDAQTIAFADALGSLSLALRGVEVEPPGLRVASAARRGAGAMAQNVRQMGGSVRVHQYGAAANQRGGS